MSSFKCEECGAYCFDTDIGYITGCEHYPPDEEAASVLDRRCSTIATLNGELLKLHHLIRRWNWESGTDHGLVKFVDRQHKRVFGTEPSKKRTEKR